MYSGVAKVHTFFKSIEENVTKPPGTNILGMLIHKTVKFGKGPEVLLRPGLRKFLTEMSGRYELVIFSEQGSEYVKMVMETLDSFGKYNIKSFGHEYYTLHGTSYVKDLKILGRHDGRIILVDLSKIADPDRPDNTIVVRKFEGDGMDDTLNKLTPLLNCNPNFTQICLTPK